MIVVGSCSLSWCNLNHILISHSYYNLLKCCSVHLTLWISWFCWHRVACIASLYIFSVSYTPFVCYRIHQRLHGDSELETVWVAQHGLHLYLSLDSPEPCVNYRWDYTSLELTIDMRTITGTCLFLVVFEPHTLTVNNGYKVSTHRGGGLTICSVSGAQWYLLKLGFTHLANIVKTQYEWIIGS